MVKLTLTMKNSVPPPPPMDNGITDVEMSDTDDSDDNSELSELLGNAIQSLAPTGQEAKVETKSMSELNDAEWADEVFKDEPGWKKSTVAEVAERSLGSKGAEAQTFTLEANKSFEFAANGPSFPSFPSQAVRPLQPSTSSQGKLFSYDTTHPGFRYSGPATLSTPSRLTATNAGPAVTTSIPQQTATIPTFTFTAIPATFQDPFTFAGSFGPVVTEPIPQETTSIPSTTATSSMVANTVAAPTKMLACTTEDINGKKRVHGTGESSQSASKPTPTLKPVAPIVKLPAATSSQDSTKLADLESQLKEKDAIIERLQLKVKNLQDANAKSQLIASKALAETAHKAKEWELHAAELEEGLRGTLLRTCGVQYDESRTLRRIARERAEEKFMRTALEDQFKNVYGLEAQLWWKKRQVKQCNASLLVERARCKAYEEELDTLRDGMEELNSQHRMEMGQVKRQLANVERRYQLQSKRLAVFYAHGQHASTSPPPPPPSPLPPPPPAATSTSKKISAERPEQKPDIAEDLPAGGSDQLVGLRHHSKFKWMGLLYAPHILLLLLLVLCFFLFEIPCQLLRSGVKEAEHGEDANLADDAKPENPGDDSKLAGKLPGGYPTQQPGSQI